MRPPDGPVTFTADRASVDQLAEHLRLCDLSFSPPLSQRVDIPAYAAKLKDRARLQEAWAGEQLVGLVAAYVEAPRAFVTNVSVTPDFRRRGLAEGLMDRCRAEARRAGVASIALEVSAASLGARRLYERLGFAVDGSGDGASLRMTLAFEPERGEHDRTP